MNRSWRHISVPDDAEECKSIAAAQSSGGEQHVCPRCGASLTDAVCSRCGAFIIGEATIAAAAPKPDVEEFMSYAVDIRAEVLRFARALTQKHWRDRVRFFGVGPRGGYVLQVRMCTCESGYVHELTCYEAIECYLSYEDPETGEFFWIYPIDPILQRRQLRALLQVSEYTFNDIAPDIPGRLPCWCVCALTAPFMRLLLADVDNPWPTKEDRKWMRASRKNGARAPRRQHRAGCSCKKCRR